MLMNGDIGYTKGHQRSQTRRGIGRSGFPIHFGFRNSLGRQDGDNQFARSRRASPPLKARLGPPLFSPAPAGRRARRHPPGGAHRRPLTKYKMQTPEERAFTTRQRMHRDLLPCFGNVLLHQLQLRAMVTACASLFSLCCSQGC